jgi:hypothetical protein
MMTSTFEPFIRSGYSGIRDWGARSWAVPVCAAAVKTIVETTLATMPSGPRASFIRDPSSALSQPHNKCPRRCDARGCVVLRERAFCPFNGHFANSLTPCKYRYLRCPTLLRGGHLESSRPGSRTLPSRPPLPPEPGAHSYSASARTAGGHPCVGRGLSRATDLRLRIDAHAANSLEAYDWPGNARELRAVLIAASLRAEDGTLRAEHLAERLASGRQSGAKTLAAVERQKIVTALEEAKGNRSRAATRVGISRRTLNRRLQEYGLHRPVSGEQPGASAYHLAKRAWCSQ